MYSDHEIETIKEQGKLVFDHSWDSGAPGVGEGAEIILEYQGYYYIFWSTGEISKPFDSKNNSLRDIIKNEKLLTITDASLAIDIKSLSDSEILSLVILQAKVGHQIEINGLYWLVTQHRQLEILHI